MINSSMTISLDNTSVPIANHLPIERFSGICDLGRELVSTNTLDVLLNSIVRQSIAILHARSCRIMTLEPDGSFSCPAAHSIETFDIANRRRVRISPIVQSFYQNVLLHDTPLILDATSSLPAELSQALRLTTSDTLYMIPLRVSQESLGILIVGEEKTPVRDGYVDEKLRTASLIADQAASAIYRARLSYRLEESQLQTVMALSNVLESRDPYTGNHSRKVTAVAVRLARRLNCSSIEGQAVRWAAMLHDIGKVGIRDDILSKKAPLDKQEWEVMRRHPEIGADIVRMSSNLTYVAALIQAHHARYDGAGYPYGLKRDMIPFGARILCLADAFSAMTDNRVYHASLSLDDAIEEIKACSGAQFDPRVVDAFLSMFS